MIQVSQNTLLILQLNIITCIDLNGQLCLYLYLNVCLFRKFIYLRFKYALKNNVETVVYCFIKFQIWFMVGLPLAWLQNEIGFSQLMITDGWLMHTVQIMSQSNCLFNSLLSCTM